MPLIFTATVRDLSHKGLGVIDHYDGRVFFARGTWPGDLGEFEIPENAKSYNEAKLLKIIKPSPDRVEISCAFKGTTPGTCGGCTWMMASYESQLKFKSKRVIHALAKRQVEYRKLNSIVGSTKIYGYRNRAQFKTNGKDLGYVSEATNVLAPVKDCMILNSNLRDLFQQLLLTLPRQDFYPAEGFLWNYIDVDDEVKLSEIKLNRRRPFKQGNTEQNENMKSWVQNKFSALPRHYPIIDLFSGSGNFTELLSEMGFENILAVEVQGVALDELKLKNLSGVRVLPLDLNQKGAWAQLAKHQPHAKAILIDPPREGIEKRRGFFKYLDNLEQIYYISCEVDSASRDLKDMTSHHWDILDITPLDLFPHTPHVEILASLRRKTR